MITNHILYKPFVQEVFPLRFKALHFVHEPSIFDWVFSLVKPFLSETIKGRVSILSELISDYITNVNYVCQNSHQKQELSAMISSYWSLKSMRMFDKFDNGYIDTSQEKFQWMLMDPY